MITEFRFAYPLGFVLLVVPLAFYMRVIRVHWQHMSGTMSYSDTRLFTGLPVGWRVRLRILPDAIKYVAFCLLVVALARPQTGQTREVLRGQGVDIVLAVDISSSMLALDFEPQNRLEAAKIVISDFIMGREFDRIGLIVFARSAYHQVPLTLDYAVLLHLLDEVQLVTELRVIESRQLDGTAIGLGIASSANMLRSSNTPSKVIILLTDGDNNAGIDPLKAATAAATLGIRLYTIGMGKPGLVDIPDRDGIIRTVESDLNEGALTEMALRGDGLYFRAENTLGLQQIYAQIDALERSNVERVVFVRWKDQVNGLLFVAFGLLCIERLLRRTVFLSIP